MRTVLLVGQGRDYTRAAENWQRDFETRTHHKVEVVDPDTRAGAQFVSVYDAVRYPSVFVLQDNGQVVQSWIGTLPAISEIHSFLV